MDCRSRASARAFRPAGIPDSCPAIDMIEVVYDAKLAMERPLPSMRGEIPPHASTTAHTW